MSKDERKRKAPTKDTLRELYLKSGNQCAFPACSRPMIDPSGKFVGQICHIEAAEKGGERFNPEQTNEDCRSFANLVLMCYEHHVVTNDVVKYKVTDLQRIKSQHEAKFMNIEDRLDEAFREQEPDSSKNMISLTNSPGSIATIGQNGDNYIVNQAIALNKQLTYYKGNTNPEFDADKGLYRTLFVFGSESGIGLANPRLIIRFKEGFASISGSIRGSGIVNAGILDQTTHDDSRGFSFATDFLQPNNFMVIETESATVLQIESLDTAPHS